jgi:hypothetical protein
MATLLTLLFTFPRSTSPGSESGSRSLASTTGMHNPPGRSDLSLLASDKRRSRPRHLPPQSSDCFRNWVQPSGHWLDDMPPRRYCLATLRKTAFNKGRSKGARLLLGTAPCAGRNF